jgi:anthranilate/para-aminobenzoate synthase component I
MLIPADAMQEDVALEEELLADGKECAEHVMLVDLGRNDVGKVCTANLFLWLCFCVRSYACSLLG